MQYRRYKKAVSMEFSSQPWFPTGILTKLEKLEDKNSNFSEFKVHTIHGTLKMIWPKGEPKNILFWKNLDELLNDKNMKPWGVANNFNFKEIDNVKSIENQKNIMLILEGNTSLVATYNPILCPNRESKFNKMEIEKVAINPIGGLKLNKHDLILFYESKINGVKLGDNLREALINSDLDKIESLLTEAGSLLGKFHKSMDKNVAPPIPEHWNNRLKRLEKITSSNTLWRAPHSNFTEAIWTHGDFNLDKIILDSSNNVWKLKNFSSVPIHTLIDSTTRFPAIRDVACAYRSISHLMHDLEIDDYELERKMKKWIFESWSKHAPQKWANAEALNAYKGGILIWEYDCALCDLFFEQVYERNTKNITKKWLSSVTRIQASMFKNRIYSALSKISAIVGFAMFFGWNYTDRYLLITGILSAFCISWALMKTYHSRAPEPW